MYNQEEEKSVDFLNDPDLMQDFFSIEEEEKNVSIDLKVTIENSVYEKISENIKTLIL